MVHLPPGETNSFIRSPLKVTPTPITRSSKSRRKLFSAISMSKHGNDWATGERTKKAVIITAARKRRRARPAFRSKTEEALYYKAEHVFERAAKFGRKH